MTTRHDWTLDDVAATLARPFHDLLADAHAVHRARFDTAVAGTRRSR